MQTHCLLSATTLETLISLICSYTQMFWKVAYLTSAVTLKLFKVKERTIRQKSYIVLVLSSQRVTM